MPKAVRELYDRLDGTLRLSEIFSTDEEDWRREAELLMLQIAKERIALLPAPLGELASEIDEDDGEPWWKALRDPDSGK